MCICFKVLLSVVLLIMDCMYVFCFLCVFFYKQKTAYEMRISDWISDVCSSDLSVEPLVQIARDAVAAGHVRLVETLAERLADECLADRRVLSVRVRVEKLDVFADASSVGVEIERIRG